jgi:hypothetical protein
MNTTELFRDVLRRMKSKGNYERYNSICTKPCNDDEERIWALCEHFWPKEYSKRQLDIGQYVINEELDPTMAKKYIAELQELLDKLGWE